MTITVGALGAKIGSAMILGALSFFTIYGIIGFAKDLSYLNYEKKLSNSAHA